VVVLEGTVSDLHAEREASSAATAELRSRLVLAESVRERQAAAAERAQTECAELRDALRRAEEEGGGGRRAEEELVQARRRMNEMAAHQITLEATAAGASWELRQWW
jgi:hypothetical protein